MTDVVALAEKLGLPGLIADAVKADFPRITLLRNWP